MGDASRLDGWLVNPAEIEATVNEHPDVLSSQVVGVEVDSRMRPVAFVVVRSGRSFDEAAIIEHCNARSARYKAPYRVFVLERFPVTESPNGVKAQKGRLREMALQRLNRSAN
jgi:fatty-acyl-CoA synthase